MEAPQDLPEDMAVEISGSWDLELSERTLGPVLPDRIEGIDLGLLPVVTPVLQIPTVEVRDASPILAIDLFGEVAPLFWSIDRRLTPGHPLFGFGEARPLLEVPRNAIARAGAVRCLLNLHDYRDPPGTRRQILLNLLKIAMPGAAEGGYGQDWPSDAERRLGSLRAPLQFTLHHELFIFYENEPCWDYQLSVTCEDGANIQAIRNQIRMLTDYLADPARLLPLDDWRMLI